MERTPSNQSNFCQSLSTESESWELRKLELIDLSRHGGLLICNCMPGAMLG